MNKEELMELAKEKYDVDSVIGYWKFQGFLDALNFILEKK